MEGSDVQPPDPEGLMERLNILLQRFHSNDFDVLDYHGVEDDFVTWHLQLCAISAGDGSIRMPFELRQPSSWW